LRGGWEEAGNVFTRPLPIPARVIIIHGENKTRVSKCISYENHHQKKESHSPPDMTGGVEGCGYQTTINPRESKENKTMEGGTGGETNPRSGPRISVIKD